MGIDTKKLKEANDVLSKVYDGLDDCELKKRISRDMYESMLYYIAYLNGRHDTATDVEKQLIDLLIEQKHEWIKCEVEDG